VSSSPSRCTPSSVGAPQQADDALRAYLGETDRFVARTITSTRSSPCGSSPGYLLCRDPAAWPADLQDRFAADASSVLPRSSYDVSTTSHPLPRIARHRVGRGRCHGMALDSREPCDGVRLGWRQLAPRTAARRPGNDGLETAGAFRPLLADRATSALAHFVFAAPIAAGELESDRPAGETQYDAPVASGCSPRTCAARAAVLSGRLGRSMDSALGPVGSVAARTRGIRTGLTRHGGLQPRRDALPLSRTSFAVVNVLRSWCRQFAARPCRHRLSN